jgi:hypothetical protein
MRDVGSGLAITQLVRGRIHSTPKGHRRYVLLAMIYTPAAPLSVTLEVRDSSRPTGWVVGRDLLASGLHCSAGSPAGAYDVRIWTEPAAHGNHTVIEFRNQRALQIYVPAHDLTDFLAASWDQVPAGAEYRSWDFDTALDRLITEHREPPKPGWTAQLWRRIRRRSNPTRN